jgi:SAM-dependent methyltransferase
MASTLDALHEPIAPLLEAALAGLDLAPGGCLVDLACGPGGKLACIARATGAARVIALDRDRAALARIRPQPAATVSRLAGDAQALPLRDACLDGACCIAALGLFATPLAALRELRRVLRPGAPLLIVTAEQRWVTSYSWPASLRERVAAVYAAGLPSWRDALAADDDLGGDLERQLRAAGFSGAHIRAFPLDAVRPWLAEVDLIAPARLRPLVRPRLSPAEVAQFDAGPPPEMMVRPLALVATALGIEYTEY